MKFNIYTAASRSTRIFRSEDNLTSYLNWFTIWMIYFIRFQTDGYVVVVTAAFTRSG